MHEALTVGAVPTLHALFTNQNGDAADPAAIALTITKPDGTQIVKAIGDLTHPSTGHYEYDQVVDQAGVWIYEFAGSGNGVDATQSEYLIVGDASTHVGPCDDWIMPDDIFDCGPCSTIVEADRDHALAATMATAASEFYWQHSGRQFSGLCDVTVRPCCTHQWCDRPRCGCPDVQMLRLPGPVRGIIEVREDGNVLAASSYRIEQSKWLVRLDDQAWRACQDQTADPATDTNTLQIRYIKGTPPPTLGVAAASELACELYRGCAPGGDCAIPSKVVNIARQGVSMQLVTPEQIGIRADGRVSTGLKVGALFLATFPGNRGRSRPGIGSPDVMPSMRRVS